MQAAQFNILAGQNRRYHAVLGIAEHVVAFPQERTVVRLVQAGEPDLLALAVALHTAGNVVLIAQHGAAGRGLPQQNIPLGVDILLHILVVVQVVGVTLVTTATFGLRRILMSWKLDSSTTATASG